MEAKMTFRHPGLALAAVPAFIVGIGSGALALLGWVLAGALLATWGYVYARTFCGGRPLNRSQLLRIAALGALSMPMIAALSWLVGSSLWLFVVGIALIWMVLVTPTGRLPPLPQMRERVDGFVRLAGQLLHGG
jgi:hypothetical protein